MSLLETSLTSKSRSGSPWVCFHRILCFSFTVFDTMEMKLLVGKFLGILRYSLLEWNLQERVIFSSPSSSFYFFFFFLDRILLCRLHWPQAHRDTLAFEVCTSMPDLTLFLLANTVCYINESMRLAECSQVVNIHLGIPCTIGSGKPSLFECWGFDLGLHVCWAL